MEFAVLFIANIVSKTNPNPPPPLRARVWFQDYYKYYYGERVPLHCLIVTYIAARAHKNGRVRACNYIKIKTGRNFLPVLKIVTCTVQAV